MRRARRCGAIAGALAALGSGPAAGQPEESLAARGASMEWGVQLQLDLRLDRSVDAPAETGPDTQVYSKPSLAWFVDFGQHFSIDGLAKAEPVRRPDGSGVFRDEGAWLEQLYATVRLAPARLYGGKIHPRLGRAWDATPGLFGTDFAEDYELADKIGVGAAVNVAAAGTHTLAVEAFFADTSPLAETAFTRPAATDPRALRPGRLRRDDGGAGNTGTPGNLAVTLTGRALPLPGDASYHVGWAVQRAGADGERDEHSLVAGAAWELAVAEGVTAAPMAEYARIRNQGGLNLHADYVTAAVGIVTAGGWSAAAHATVRPVRDDDAGTSRVDYLAGGSVGYDLGAILDGLSVTAGYKRERLDGADRNTLGAAITYVRAFGAVARRD